MHLIRIGYRTVNLEYLIEAADSELGAPPDEAPPGMIRVAVYPGKIFDVGGDAAALLRLHLDDAVKAPPDAPERPRGESCGKPQRTHKVGRMRDPARPSSSESSPHDE